MISDCAQRRIFSDVLEELSIYVAYQLVGSVSTHLTPKGLPEVIS
jgi:hypothetical protein